MFRTSQHQTCRLGFILVLVLMAAPPLHGAEPLTLDDMVALLSAGIGSDLVRMQAERTGTHLDPEVADLLALFIAWGPCS